MFKIRMLLTRTLNSSTANNLGLDVGSVDRWAYLVLSDCRISLCNFADANVKGTSIELFKNKCGSTL
jgi:hypothetical protein